MIKFELNIITQIDSCCHGENINRATKITLALFCDQLAKYELHMFNNISKLLQFCCENPAILPQNLTYKQNLRNLNKDHCAW